MNRKILLLTTGEHGRQVIAAALDANECDIETVSSEEQLVTKAQEWSPSVIIVETQPGVQNSEALCQTLKSKKSTRDIPVVFLADDTDFDSLIKMYEAGVSDCLSMDAPEQLISAKLNKTLTDIDKTATLNNKIKEAKKNALVVMEDMARLGSVLRFVDKAALCTDIDALAKLILQTFESLEMDAVIAIFYNHEPCFFNNDGSELNPIERKVLLAARQNLDTEIERGKRFVTLKNRIICADMHVAMLIKNASNDEAEAGRQRDLLGAFLNSVQSKVFSLEEAARKNRLKLLGKEMLGEFSTMISNIESRFREYGVNSSQVMDNLLVDVNLAFSVMELNEQQERVLMDMIEGAMGKLVSLHTYGIQLEREFSKLATRLGDFMEASSS